MTKHSLETEKAYEMLWNYFSFHSNQRITVMNFYIVLESAMVGGFMAVYGNNVSNISVFEIVIGIAMCFFSFVFYCLDLRIKHMIKMSESALIEIEKAQQGFSPEMLIFSLEKEETRKQREKNKLLILLSYSKLFGLIYLFFAVIGMAMIIFSLLT